MNTHPLPRSGNRRIKGLFVLLALLAVFSFVWGPQARRFLLAQLLPGSQVPSQSAFDEVVGADEEALPFLERMWATGKTVHRQLVAQYLKDQGAVAADGAARSDSILIAGSGDADASVRELSLSALAARLSPHLVPLALAQLRDPDPLIRLLGLQYVAKAGADGVLPAVMPLLDDTDLRVVTRAEAALRAWTGEDFGVRAVQSVAQVDDAGGETLNPANVELIKRGVQRRKEWWKDHSKDFSPVVAPPIFPTPRLPVADFAARDLNGRKVRLSDFRGKVVLLNFWTTWCTACAGEIPDLIAFQKKHAERLVVLGVSLDGVPDNHGHGEGHDEPGHDQTDSTRPNELKGSREATVLQKVERFVRARGIPYRILLDPDNEVGGRFNGGELPTNVLIDAGGNMRRRFIGARSLPVWEEMLAEITGAGTAGDIHPAAAP